MWYIFVLLVGLLIIVVYVRCTDLKQSKFHINNKRENREEYLQIEIYILHSHNSENTPPNFFEIIALDFQ